IAADLASRAIGSRRGSGTATSPGLGSVVPDGSFSACAPAVSDDALKQGDLRTFGSPTIPQLNPMARQVGPPVSLAGAPERFGSTKPLAAIARCTLFWKLASSPCASREALSAMISHRVSTHARSLLLNGLSTK